MKKKYLEIGKIVSTQGIKGEVRVQAWCDSPDFLCEFDELYIHDKAADCKVTIGVERAYTHKNVVVLKLNGIDTVEQAQEMRNRILYIDREDIELDEGTYFIQDLVGLRVIDADDESIVYGELAEVTQTGANDVYHIKQGDKLLLAPAIPQVIIETDIPNGVMKIRPLKGLFDDED